ncbi:hypothetical protein HJC23_001985 [Cyclotella cryptica]|uniref:BED-type domain-containing protein n=1 Tax=Cyclotella cryptica TaxID=29204 RepID=A0ABD3PNX5_9STRA
MSVTPSQPNDPSTDAVRLIEPGQRRAKCWTYFKIYDLDHHPDKSHKARCSLCEADVRVTDGSTSGLVRHLRNKHAKESEELATTGTAECQSPSGGHDHCNSSQPALIKRKRASMPEASKTEVVEAKIKKEEHNLKMWEHACDKLKRLKREMKEAIDNGDVEEIEELEADIRGFKKRKANFATLLGLGLD